MTGYLTRAALIIATVTIGCSEQPVVPRYERVIAPILTNRCTMSRAGACHTDDGTGRAQGNLDLTSYAAVTRRPDVLRRFGSYPFPLLLMKAVADPPGTNLPVNVGDGYEVPLFIRHAGGALLALPDADFRTLDKWLQDGAPLDDDPIEPEVPTDRGPCSPVIRTDLFAQPTLDAVDTSSPLYQQFQAEAWPVLKDGCLGRRCHGARDTNQIPTIELYFTCGDDDRQQRFNYLMARTYTGEGGGGQLTQKALRGSSYHTGGYPFETRSDPGYQAIRDWAIADSPLQLQVGNGETFFRTNVQPTLVARGCYLEACHSLSNFNFYKPLAGTDGLYGTRIMRHNYLQARFMLGVESLDPEQGRLLKKNLMAESSGMRHRGGALFVPREDCTLRAEQVLADPNRRWYEEHSAGCIIEAWHELERGIAVDRGSISAVPGAVGVFVRRPANSDRHIDFDTYRPGADLLRMDLAQDARGRVTGLSQAPTSLLGGCGVDVGAADVRRPDIKGDGTEVIFAMRTSAGEGLDLWTVNIDGSECKRLGLARGTDSAGTPLHHFDPIYAPGGIYMFASTQGDESHADPARRYPSRTPKYFLPNSNIWVYAPGGTPRRLSYLSGAEFAPRLLHSREVVYAVEKAAPDFYQISTRAIRMDDGGGYRPELGQRPKMGYGQVTEVRELVDFRTAFIGSDPGTYFGGGTLGVQDITLGLEEKSFEGPGFIHPTQILDPQAAVRSGQPGTGVYRSPTPLADGRILVAYSPGEVDLGDPSASVDYGLWVVDPAGIDEPWLLFDTPGAFDIEPVIAFKRIFVPQPARIHHGDFKRGEYVFHSMPLFAPLMNDNTRLGIMANPDVVAVRILEQMSPPDGVTSPDQVSAQLSGPEQVYVQRRLIGEIPLLADGSVRFMAPASTPLMFQLLAADGSVIDWQREEEQIGPGETQPRMIPKKMFNGICGGCHNALDGSELGVAVGADVLTGASTLSEAASAEPVDLYSEPSSRPNFP